MEPIPPPPPIYVNYPRAQGGSLEEFDALVRARKVINGAFLGLVFLNIVGMLSLTRVDNNAPTGSVVLLGGFTFMVIAAMCFGGWGTSSYARATSKNVKLYTVLGAILICVPYVPLIGAILMSNDVQNRLKAYGIQFRLFRGPNKQIREARMRLLAAQQGPGGFA